MTLLHITIQYFPQKEIATGCPGGVDPDDSLSSVSLYAHVLYEGIEVRGYRTLLFCSSTLLAEEFLASQ